jgi:hypothetical protein
MKLYISEGAVMLLAVFYTPLVLWIAWKLWKNLGPGLGWRVAVVVPMLAIAAAIPMWDVIATSRDMAELCPEAGVHINRSVRVDGYLTNFGFAESLKLGFKYIEAREPGGRVTVFRRRPSSVETVRHLPGEYHPVSRFEFVLDDASGYVVPGTLHVDMDRSVVRDRNTGEELGYSTIYRAYPGWVDRNTISRIGRVQWICPKEPDPHGRLEREVLLPNS